MADDCRAIPNPQRVWTTPEVFHFVADAYRDLSIDAQYPMALRTQMNLRRLADSLDNSADVAQATLDGDVA